MTENTDNTKTNGENDLVYDQFYKAVKRRMDDYEGCVDPKLLAHYFYQVVNSTAHEKKFSIVRADPRFKNVNNLLKRALDKDETDLSFTAIRNLIEDFCQRGCCESVGVVVLRDFTDDVEKKLVNNLPDEMKELPRFFASLINTLNVIKQNPTYFDWTEELAKDFISEHLKNAGMKELFVD